MRTVGDAMQQPVVVDESATIQEASARMLDARAHVALVVRDGIVSGLATAEGVATALAEGRPASETRVAAIVDHDAPTFGPDHPLADAHQVMRSAARSLAVVVGDHDEPLGILAGLGPGTVA
jgi:predicted transcriptional regulator